jgi:hypothetical protein
MQQRQGTKNTDGLLDYCLVIKASFRIPEKTKEGIVRWWPRITTVALVIVLLLLPFLKIWLNLAEFGVRWSRRDRHVPLHGASPGCSMVANGDIAARAVQTKGVELEGHFLPADRRDRNRAVGHFEYCSGGRRRRGNHRCFIHLLPAL